MNPKELSETLLKMRNEALGKHEFPDIYDQLEELAFIQGVYYTLSWMMKERMDENEQGNR